MNGSSDPGRASPSITSSYSRRIQRALLLEAGQVLSDIGCGSSYVEIEFAGRGVRVVWVDISSNAFANPERRA